MSAVCPYCGVEVTAGGSASRFCTSCGTAHHEECWQENGGCTVFGCASAPPDEPKVNVAIGNAAGQEGAPATSAGYPSQPPAQQYGAMSQAPPPAWQPPVAPPPPGPPPPPGYPSQPPPPPPQGYGQQGYPPQAYSQPGYPPPQQAYAQPQAYGAPYAQPYVQILPGQAPPSMGGYYVPPPQQYVSPGAYYQPLPKNRTSFIMLGIFLGCFGVHNFYAGYTGKAIAQLCITLCSLFTLSIVTAIWAIVEICTIDRDSNNVPMI